MAQIPKTGTLYISDVKNALGETTTDLGRLCKSPKINPWAKYKPVRLANPFPDPNSDWWKAADGNCGFKLPNLLNLGEAGATDWEYQSPSGGANAPYRLNDFRGYQSEALPLLSHAYGGELRINKYNYSGNTYTFTFWGNIQNDKTLSIFDFDKSLLGDLYLSAQIVPLGSTGDGIVYSAATTVTSGGFEIVFPVLNFEGSYTVRFFLSGVKYNGETPGPGPHYPTPGSLSMPAELKMTVGTWNPFTTAIDRISWALNGTYVTPDVMWYTGGKRLRTPGSVCLHGIISNTSDSAVSISLSRLRLEGQSFFGSQESAYITAAYNAAKQPISGALNIPGGGSLEAYLYVENFLNLQNGSDGLPMGDSPVRDEIGLWLYPEVGGRLYMGGLILAAVWGSGAIVDDIW